MGKTRSWITYVKRLFTQNSKPKSEKSRDWGWAVNKKLNFRRRSCYLAMQEPPRSALDEAAEEQRKQAVAVAVATAAAAEAAVSATSAAAEVVRLANVPYDAERKISGLATIKIQAAYRGHLARKALCALKGTVKLQALVRGELTRKRVSLLVHRRRVAVPLLDYLSRGQNRRSLVSNEGIKFEEHKGLGRIRRYSFSDPVINFDSTLQERKNDQNPQERMTREAFVKPMSRSNTIAVDTARLAKLKLETARKHRNVDDSKSPRPQPRKSFCHAKQKSTGDSVSSLPNSPAYMAATECTKAKSRSLSTPRQRLRLCDTYSGPDSPYKLSLSSGGSFNGEIEARTHKRNSDF